MKLRHLLYFLAAVPFVFAACNEEPEPTPVADPTVNVTAIQAAETSLTFSIDVKDAVSAAYVVVEATEAEPTAEEIIGSGKPVAVNKLSAVIADGLTPETEYQIVAAAAGNNKVVKSPVVKMTTLKDESGNQGGNQGGNEQPEPNETEFNLLSEPKMTFEAEGGFGFIAYEVINPIEDAVVEATCAAAWVSLTIEDQVAFVVSPNTESVARQTKVVLTYGQEHTLEVVVEQKAAPAGPIEGFDVVFTSASYTMASSYGDAEIYQFRNDDGVQANVYFEKSLAHPMAPGTYAASNYVTAGQPTFSTSESRVSFYDNDEKVTGVYFTGGTIKVEIVNEQYVVTFDTTISYNNGIPFKGTFTGLFANDTLWNGNVQPEPTPEYNTWTSASLVSIANGVVEIDFVDAESNTLRMGFYVDNAATYLPAGSYAPGMPMAGKYSIMSNLTVAGTRYDYNTDMNTLNNTVEVVLLADDTYTFTFNNLIFGTDQKVSGSWTGLIDGLTQNQGGNEGGNEGGEEGGETLEVDHLTTYVVAYADGNFGGYTFSTEGGNTPSKGAFVRILLNAADRQGGVIKEGTYTHILKANGVNPELSAGQFCVERYCEDAWVGWPVYGKNVGSADMTVTKDGDTYTVVITVDGIKFGYQGTFK